MKDLLVKAGLNDEQTTNILNAMKEAKVYTTKLENIDERYSKLKTQKTELETQIKERDTQLSELSKNNKDNQELLKQIEQLQLSNKQTTTDYEAKINQMQFDYALDSALSNAKCKNTKAIKALLDMNNIKYQEGKIDGLENQLNSLKESDSYLFEIETPGNTGGVGNFGRKGNPALTKEDFSKMSYNDRVKLYNENPETYASLSGE